MGQTITFRPTKKLAEWIEQAAEQMGVSQGQFIRSHLEQARGGDRKSQEVHAVRRSLSAAVPAMSLSP